MMNDLTEKVKLREIAAQNKREESNFLFYFNEGM